MTLSCLTLKSISLYCTLYLSSTDWPGAFKTPEFKVQYVLYAWSNLSSSYVCYLNFTKRMICISAVTVLSLRKCSLLPFSFTPAFLGSCSHTSLCAGICLSECHWFFICCTRLPQQNILNSVVVPYGSVWVKKKPQRCKHHHLSQAIHILEICWFSVAFLSLLYLCGFEGKNHWFDH